MARTPRRPERVNDALQHVLQRIDPDRRLELFRVWATEVGAAVAARATPAGFRDGILSVRVNGATWMQELQFAKETIRQRLNQRLGSEVVRDVYFVSGGGESTPPAPTRKATPADVEDADEPIDLPKLRDPRLAEIFTRIARAHRRRSRD
jgi:predicted nucleic acid-binding Zn ribbon protein